MDGKTVLGDGGGVCQVSTTLFRAVLSAGLPVVERRAHAYRVGYYEQGFGPGLDATVYSPTTDFKFKNNTDAYLLIQTEIDLNNLALTFEIYGTDDGRIATTSKPVITSQSSPAEDLYVDDPTLKAGVIKQIEHRAYGAKVIFDYKVIRNGEELINQKFVSNYRSWQAVYLRGTGI
jgi:vancomycin resistance protein YoaR